MEFGAPLVGSLVVVVDYPACQVNPFGVFLFLACHLANAEAFV
jgi:hypothetical protein